MSVIVSFLIIIVSIILLMVSANNVVNGSSSIAKRFGVPSLVIGLTIVAFGTSAPELIVNLIAALRGTTDIALGNIIGSNIANILLILGITAVIHPLSVRSSTIWKEIPFAFLAMILLLFISNDILINNATTNIVSRSDGLILLALFGIFLYSTVRTVKKKFIETTEIKEYPLYLSITVTFGGLIGLFLGGKWLVQNAIYLAQLWGVSEQLIGLTIVAIGTSIPEMITSIVAVKKGHIDIAMGNIIGSNIFNILWILGITATVTPIPVSYYSLTDIIIGSFLTLLVFIFNFIGKKNTIERWQGIILIVLYIGYIVFALVR